MVLGASLYASIYSTEGALVAQHAEAEEKELKEEDGIHLFMTILLSKEQSSKVTLGAVYQIKVSSSRTGAYKLVRQEDDRLPLRRNTFRSETALAKFR